MKIEAGKYYKTRAGNKARVYATDGHGDFPAHGAVLIDGWRLEKWTLDGKAIPRGTYPTDLVSEWTDAVEMDWSVLPKWAMWIAMDASMYWYWYENQPIAQADSWDALAWGTAGPIPNEYKPKWTGDWRDSLVEVKR